MSKAHRVWIVIVAATTAWAVPGCSDYQSPTEPEEEEPEITRVTSDFSGSLHTGDTSCHSFETTQVGDVDLSITSLQPLDTLTIGMGIGTPDESAETGCTLFASDSAVRLLDILQSPDLAVAEYCVCVFDVGNIFMRETVSYTLNVTYP